VFSGQFDHALDEKGRVSIPSRFREILQGEGHDRLLITNFIFQQERCLELYAPGEWDRLVEKLNEKSAFDPSIQLFQVFFIGGAHEVQVDRQGRVLIPNKLREFARLEREVTFSAFTNHFQLWGRETLAKIRRTAEDRLMQDADFLVKINL
jgi:transcriptional regulator MraZ